MALKLGIKTEFLETDWRRGVEPEKLLDRLKKDTENKIKAVCVVHNETSTGSTSRINEVRQAINSANHEALLMVDTISGLASMEYKHDEWGVDVTVSGSQKGLMLPPGLSFNAVSEKAKLTAKKSKMKRSYWDWHEQIEANKQGSFPYTPATNLLYGLKEAIVMLHEEGLDNVFKRHDRHAKATREAVQAWGLEVLCEEEKDYSSVLTAVIMPNGYNADEFRKVILENFNMSLGNGLSKLAGKVFRIGHLGDFNDLMLMGTLSGIEMGLSMAEIPHQKGGLDRAATVLSNS
jgi:alanine-glyoxylate transaminase/serine-glyoxylate transaminase/serine-pyruvate transaminase